MLPPLATTATRRSATRLGIDRLIDEQTRQCRRTRWLDQVMGGAHHQPHRIGAGIFADLHDTGSAADDDLDRCRIRARGWRFRR